METQLKLPWPVARERTGNCIPIRCRTCWHREGARCFNDKLKEVPTELRTFTDRDGDERSYTARLGNELTDDHVRECRAFQAWADRRMTLVRAFAGEKPFVNEFGGGAR